MLDGTPISGPAYIEGYVVGFGAGAKEKGGQVAIGAGSATLVMRNASNNRSITLQPIAVISQAKGDSVQEGRWRFDTKNFFVGTMGGLAEVGMAFEFLVPNVNPNDDDEIWSPVALYVRGVRFDLSDPNDPDQPIKPNMEFATPEDRTSAVDAGGFLVSVTANAPKISGGENWTPDKSNPNAAIRMNNRLPDNITLNGGELTNVERSKGQQIINCVNLQISPKQLAQNDVERSLRVEEFQPGPGTSVISINVSKDIDKFSAVDQASAGATGAPTVVDDKGQRYPAIGYVYRDRNEVKIRFTPGSPLEQLAEAPSVSRSRDDQKLFLIFRVAPGVKIMQYAVGTTGIVDIKGGLEVKPQTNK
jgi:hypothetical protein